jgi:TDG/mug DNA glycosylase family protein
MPGAASLQAGEYYAHPRNAFWMIAESLWSIAREAPYPARVRALESAGIAVWDVLRTCRRSGSLDSGIERQSIVANDFRGFLQRHPGIRRIYFNGNTARQLYDRHVLEALSLRQQQISRFTLPSTSPANARASLGEKTLAWSAISNPPEDYS